MSQFEDYVRQQAAQRDKARDEAAEHNRAVDAAIAAEAKWAAGIMESVIDPTLESAANAMKGHAETTIGNVVEQGLPTAYLQIGKQHAPRQVRLMVQRLGQTFTITVSGAGRRGHKEVEANESTLARALDEAVREAVDRYFGTNDHKHS